MGSIISNWDKNGVVDVYSVRDYTDIITDGYGKMTGLRIAAEEEYSRNSQEFGASNESVETAK